MLELIVTIADRLLGLLKAGQERDRQLHDDFLVGFSSSMEELHRNYLETFSGYRDSLQTASPPLDAGHPLIDEITKDSLFTDQLRAKVRALSDYEGDPAFGKVARAAAAYLLGGTACAKVLVNGRQRLNAPRSHAVIGLKEIFSQAISDTEKKRAGTQLLDRIVEDIQLEYSSFIRAEAAVKRELLDQRL